MASQNPVVLGQSYTVSAEIENDSPSPITVDLSWAEIYPASPVVKGTPGAGDIPGISLGADDSTTVPLGTFSHTYQWIPQPNPITAFESGDISLLQELKTSLLKVVDAAANQVASGRRPRQLVSAVESIGNFVASHEASPPQTTAAIQYQVTLTDEDGQQYDADPLQVAVNVPLSKQLAYDASKVVTSVAGKAMKAGVAALVAGTGSRRRGPARGRRRGAGGGLPVVLEGRGPARSELHEAGDRGPHRHDRARCAPRRPLEAVRR